MPLVLQFTTSYFLRAQVVIIAISKRNTARLQGSKRIQIRGKNSIQLQDLIFKRSWWKTAKRGNDSVCKIGWVNWFLFMEMNSMWWSSTRERHFQVKENWTTEDSYEKIASFAITRSNVWPLCVRPLISCLRLKQSNKNQKSIININNIWN